MRLASAIIVFALLAAACGDDTDANPEAGADTTASPDSSTSDDPSSTTGSTGSTVDPTASYRGVTEDVIRVGITAVDWDTLAAAGIDFGRTTSDDLYVAALEAINDRGGINGRMLEIHPATFLPVGSIEFDRVCTELTQDEEVFVVIGQALEDQVLCLIEVNSTAAVVVAGMTDPILERADAPFATIWATFERQAENMVSILEDAGELDDRTIGVIGSIDTGVLEYRTIVDAFVAAGYDVVEGLIGDNDTDLEETARDQAIIYERMKSAGVDFTVSTTGVPLEIANAEEAGYETDQWMLSIVMAPEALVDAGVDLHYLDGALAVVNTPVGTSAQPEMAFDEPTEECISDLEERTGRELSFELGLETSDLTTALYACAQARILEQGLTNAGTDLNHETFLAGLGAIGEIELPGYFESSLEPGDLGAAKGLRLVRFDAADAVWVPVD